MHMFTSFITFYWFSENSLRVTDDDDYLDLDVERCFLSCRVLFLILIVFFYSSLVERCVLFRILKFSNELSDPIVILLSLMFPSMRVFL